MTFDEEVYEYAKSRNGTEDSRMTDRMLAYRAGAKSKEKRIAELEAQIEKMKAELHHRLVSPSHDDSDCLDKIVGLDRLWQFGQEF